MLSAVEAQVLSTSFSVASLALLWSLPLAIACAFLLARQFPGKFLLDGLVHLPIILPPVLTGFLLVIVMMTFGGLISAYVVIATNGAAEWHPFSLPIQVWISTVLLLASSGTYHFGWKRLDNGDRAAAKNWFIATTALGAAFISSQLLTWLELRSRGFYLSGNPYAGFFYILTGVHAVHVIGGMIALASVLLRVWYPTSNENSILKRRSIAEVVGWYWHFMDGVWLVLFVLLGFWK